MRRKIKKYKREKKSQNKGYTTLVVSFHFIGFFHSKSKHRTKQKKNTKRTSKRGKGKEKKTKKREKSHQSENH